MKPFFETFRRVLAFRGRQGSPVTITIHAYRDKVWIEVFDSPFVSEAILQPDQAETLVDTVNQATKEARRYQDGS